MKKQPSVQLLLLIALALIFITATVSALQVIYLSSDYDLLVYCLEGTDPQIIQYDGYIQVICDPAPQTTYLPTILK